MKRTKTILPLLWLLLIATTLNLFGCLAPKKEEPYDFNSPSTQSVDLMASFASRQSSGKEADTAFRENQLRLAAELFAAAYEAKGGNVMISPLSIQLALAMTANGADGATREEMETLLGGELSLEVLNQYLRTYVASLPSGEKYKLNVANSIWFRNIPSLTVRDSFLQINADYYGAAAYKSPFDASTVKEINDWVNDHTDGMIPTVLEEIRPDDIMYLINAIVFDAEWQTPYEDAAVMEGPFHALDGSKQTVEMMYGEEHTYLSSDNATGFLKPYAGGRYSFAAILPNEGITLDEYAASLDADELKMLLTEMSSAKVTTAMPKFSYDFELIMDDILAELGMPTAFNGTAADFSRLGHSTDGNIYIGEVIHKTHIGVDALGTKAGAVTMVTMRTESAPSHQVILSRPFVYMILDNETNLPIFIGTLASLA